MNRIHRLLAGISASLTLIAAAFADAPVAVVTGPNSVISGFELKDNGLYYWSPPIFSGPNHSGPVLAGVLRDGVIVNYSTVAGRSIIQRNSHAVTLVDSPSLYVGGLRVPDAGERQVAFAGNTLYYFDNLRINYRSAFGPSPNTPGNDFSGVGFGEVGAMTAWAPYNLYWSVRGGAASDQGEIRSKPLNGGPGGGDSIIVQGVGKAAKLEFVSVVDRNTGAIDHNSLIILNTDGVIYEFQLFAFQFGNAFGTLHEIAYNVTDFVIRSETYVGTAGVFHIPTTYVSTRLWVTTGVNLGSDRLPGHVVSFDLSNNYVANDAWNTGDVNLQLTSITADADHLYFTRMPVQCFGGLFGCGLAPAGADVVRWDIRDRPSRIFFPPGNPASIAVNTEGRNLRSDGQNLYWASGNQILQLPVNASPLVLDYGAIGVEAVQVVQDFNNSQPLVQGKETLVRGYAALLQNNTSLSGFVPTGWLRGFVNGVELPGSPLWPANSPTVDGASDLKTLRSSLDRSYNFYLPPSWVAQAGGLQLQFTVNPTRSVPETGSQPLANNTASASLTLVGGRSPTIVFKAMSSTLPNYDPDERAPGRQDILNRAVSLLPVNSFRLFYSPGSVTKPVVTWTGIKQRSFSLPDDAQAGLNWLEFSHFLSSDPGPDTHWVGTYPPQVSSNRGIGSRNGEDLTLVMQDDSYGNPNPWMTIEGGGTLAHELGHNWGRKHIDDTQSGLGCGTLQPAGPYDVPPQDPCNISVVTDLANPAAAIGWDSISGSLIKPTAAADIMTYANNKWMSPYNWNALIGAIPVSGIARKPAPPLSSRPRAKTAHDPVFVVSGTLDTVAGMGTLDPVLRLPANAIDGDKVAASLQAALALPADSAQKLRVLDAQGNVLDERPLVTYDGADGADPVAVVRFLQAIPAPDGAVGIELISNGTAAADAAASPNPPVITLAVPAVDLTANSLGLTWDASDADGDVLLFTVQFSSDAGAQWTTLSAHQPELGFASDTARLPGGTNCVLRVLATDGFNTTVAVTDPFSLPRHAPVAALSGVHDGQAFSFGARVSASATAYDAEDGGLSDTAVQWTVSGPQARSGVGRAVRLENLAPGSYTLGVTATDSDGSQGSTAVSFTVLPVAVGDAAAPVQDGVITSDEAAGAPIVRLVPGVPEPFVRLGHAAGALQVGVQGLPLSAEGGSPAMLEIWIHGSGDGQALGAADVQLGVTQDGALYRRNAVNGVWTPYIDPAFSAVVAQTTDRWSVEMAIPESLTGGWNHPATMAFEFAAATATPTPAVVWPETADPQMPNTWAAAQFGGAAATPPPAPPVAVIHAPAVVSFGAPLQVTLDGSLSFDPSGSPLTYSWQQTGGAPVTLAGANLAAASFETPALAAATNATFQLTVNNGQADSQPVSVSVALIPVTLPLLPPAPPALTVGLTTNGEIQLSWPVAATGYFLQRAASPGGPWENEPSTASVSGDSNTVTVATDLTARFWRLSDGQPSPTPQRIRKNRAKASAGPKTRK